MQAALGAAEMAGRKVKIFAVEKNPYAVVTLMTQVRSFLGKYSKDSKLDA